jgi:alanine racemase
MNTYTEINLQAVKHNIEEIRKLLKPEVKFMAVVKANAYGHGSVAISRAAVSAGADYLAVANLKEALELREAGIVSPILVLTESPISVVDEIVQYDLSQTIYSFDEAKSLSEEAVKKKKTARVHIKVDTGMGRVGVAPSEAVAFAAKVSSLPNLELEGVFTHFAKAEDKDDDFTKKQFEKFNQLIPKMPNVSIKHSANSAAVLYYPETHLDMVRVGLMMYGLYPSGNGRSLVNLKPALSFKSRIAYLKRIPKGTPLSYGCTYITPSESTIATIPVGYADGFSRALSNKGQVIIRGKRYPVVGRVTMDLIMVNVGDAKVEIGDEVVLIGEQKDQCITADEIAKLEDTISYEVICGIGKRVPRIYK